MAGELCSDEAVFLRLLNGLDRPATRRQAPLGSDQKVNAMRQRCRRKGWVEYTDGGKGLHPIGWIITPAGREALARQSPAQDGEGS